MNGPGSSAARASTAAAGSSGTRSSRTSTDANEHRRRLDRVAALRGVERARGRLALAVGGEAVDGVGRQDDEPPGPERGDGRVDAHASGVTPLDDPVAAGEVLRHAHVDVALRRRAARRRRTRRRSCASSTSAPPGPERARRRPDERLGRALGRRARRAGSQSTTSGASDASSSSSHVGRVGDDEVPAVARQAGEQVVAQELDREARALRVLPREREGVLARRRSPVTRAPGCSSAIASAIAPDPGADVEDARRAVAVEQREAPLDERLGLGAGDQRARGRRGA